MNWYFGVRNEGRKQSPRFHASLLPDILRPSPQHTCRVPVLLMARLMFRRERLINGAKTVAVPTVQPSEQFIPPA